MDQQPNVTQLLELLLNRGEVAVAGVLFVDAIHEDVPFSRPISSGVQGELESLASWLRVELSPHAR